MMSVIGKYSSGYLLIISPQEWGFVILVFVEG
jgi:hypothetical protein